MPTSVESLGALMKLVHSEIVPFFSLSQLTSKKNTS